MRRFLGAVSRRRLVTIVLAVGALATLAAQVGSATDPDASDIVAGIGEVADALEDLTAVADDLDDLPLSPLDALGPDGIDPATVVDDILTDAVAAGAENGLEQLRAALEGADLPASGITVGCAAADGDTCATPVTVTTTGEPDATQIDVALPVSVQRTMSSPVTLATSVTGLNGGTLTADVIAATTLTFRLIPGVTDVSQRFAVVGEPVLTTTATISSPNVTIPASLGFTEITATLDGLAGSLALTTTLNDPDSDGLITRDEFTTTSLVDLTTIAAAGDITGDIELDTALTAAAPDVTLPFSDSLVNGFDPPDVTVGDLGGLTPFTEVTPATVLTGVGQLGSALNGATGAAGVQLPFIREGLRNAADLAQPFLDFLARQAVVCGTAKTTPPTGDVTNLAPAEDGSTVEVYCQAGASQAPTGTTTWTSLNGTLSFAGVEDSSGTAADANDTVGPSPTAFAVFEVQAPGRADVQVTYGSGGPTTTAELPASTAQELADKLADLAGFPDVAPVYDPATTALTFQMSNAFDPDPASLHFDVGDQLEAATGLIGVSQPGADAEPAAPGTRVSVDVGAISFASDLGILLVGDPADITGPDASPGDPGKNDLDRFFLALDSGPELSVGDLAVTAGTPAPFVGRLGFLGVQADLTTFALTRNDDTQPVVTIDVTDEPVGTTSGGSIPDTLRLRRLLFDPAGFVSASPINLQFDAALTVSADVSGNTIGTGTVTVAWPDVATGTPTVTTGGGFGDTLRAFDVAPNVFGEHDGSSDASTLTLLASLPSGVDPVGAELENITDGSSCEVGSATATTLTCAAPLAGSPAGTTGANSWDDGDRFRLRVADPLALLLPILDRLTDLATGLASAEDGALGSVLDTNLPLVDRSPRQLLTQAAELKRAATELMEPTGASITCGTSPLGAGGLPTVAADDEDGVGVLDGPSPHEVHCAVASPKEASAVTWSVLQGGTVASDGDAAGTVAPVPSANVRLSLTESRIHGPLAPGGYRVQVRYTDADGDHTLEFPPRGIPGTLQAFEQALEEELGLPAGLLDLTLNQTTTPAQLEIGLQFARCTTGHAVCAGLGLTPEELGVIEVDPVAVPLAVDLTDDGVPGLATVDAATELSLSYGTAVDVTLGVPLTASPTVEVLSGGVTVAGGIDSDPGGIGLSAALGPLTVDLGTAAAVPSGDTAVGTFKLGATANVTLPAGDPTASGYFAGVSGAFDGTPTVNCGSIDDGGTPEELAGLGCGLLSVSMSGTPLGEIGFEVDPATLAVAAYVSQDLRDAVADLELDFAFLLRALPYLLEQLEATLDGTAQDVKIPVVGDALDGGADIVRKFNDLVIPVVDAASSLDPPTAADVESTVRDFLWANLGPSGANLVLEPTYDPNDPAAWSAADDAADITVNVTCDGGCGSAALYDVQDIRVVAHLGQVASGPVGGIPFDIGLDGLPLDVAGAVTPVATWRVIAGFGLDRTGPYLIVDEPNDELQVSAQVGLGDAPASCPPFTTDELTGLGLTSEFPATNERCLAGSLGFLGADVKDSDGAGTLADLSQPGPTQLGLNVSMDLSNSAGGGTLTLNDLIAGNLDGTPSFTGGANVDLLFRTGIRGQAAGFPSVVGTVRWDLDLADLLGGGTLDAPTVGDLHLDTGAFIEEFLDPVVGEVRNITSPLKPVVDTLNAPIPVITQLADLVGAGPFTLMSLMEEASGSNLTVIRSLAAFVGFTNNLPTGGGFIPLGTGDLGGAFTIDPVAAQETQSHTTAASVIDTITSESPGSLWDKAPKTGSGDLSEATTTSVPATEDDLPGTFGVPGLTFPFMEDAGSIFSLLMGQDATLVRYDFGTMRATAGFSYDFGPFFIGPVPVTAGVFGSATLEGRLALGYDTSGLRKTLEGGSGVHLFDGVFIDDLDGAGQDVAEVALIGEVGAQAAVSVFVAKAGIEGGITLTVALNLNDSPTPDGKLRIEEVVNKLSNPICLFDVEGALEAFLRFFLEIDYFIGSERWDWELLRVTLLDFSASCEPPAPKLASFDPGTGDLTLLMGPLDRREARGVGVATENEKFTVRQIGPGVVTVEAFGIVQEYPQPGQSGAIDLIKADGDSGNDTIVLAPGTNPAEVGGEQIYFTIASQLTGGVGNDNLIGGDGTDTIDGGLDNDKIEGNGGGDSLTGGPPSIGDGESDVDSIDGGRGIDTIVGGDDGDQLRGGPDGDTVNGGAGNDFLNGGPGADPSASPPPGTADGDDTLIGNTGNDTIEGGFGNDVLYGDVEVGGDTAAKCAFPGGILETDGDNLDGGAGDDTLVGGGGPDTVVGGGGHDDLCGNDGNDTLDGDSPDASSVLGQGDDFLDGGRHDDVLSGRGGADVLQAGPGADRADGGAGDDDVRGGTGRDVLRGGDGADIVVGDAGTIDGSDASGIATRPSGGSTALAALVTPVTTGSDSTELDCETGDSGDAGFSDCIFGGAGGDALFGEAGRDRMFGDDHEDWMSGGDDQDTMRGGLLDDLMHGDAGDDTMFGDSGADEMFGDGDQDTMRGGIGDDDMEGNAGADTMSGDADQDDLIGGSSTAGADDGPVGSVGDAIDGNAGVDVIIGDNGTIERFGGSDPDDGSIARTVTLFDVDGAAATRGPDDIDGGDGNDRIFGQGDGDTIAGGPGRDLVDGNGGTDTIDGEADDDLIVGGSSDRATLDGGSGAVDHTDVGDAGDVIHGGDGDDVVLGDNGVLNWNGTTSMTTSAVGSFGDDEVHAGPGEDQVYGQLGGDDLYGDGGHDYIVGDLGSITPPATGAARWPTGWIDTFGDPVGLGAPIRMVALIAPDVGGEDDIWAGSGEDFVFGGAATDTIEGGVGDDHLEGNGGQDEIFGLSATFETAPTTEEVAALTLGVGDEDDIIGGSSRVHPDAVSPGAADAGELVVHGNADHDVVIGDNGDILRMQADPTTWSIDDQTGGVLRAVELFDRDVTAPTTVAGGDLLHGDDGNDRMLGQADGDVVKGNADDDILQGNQDGDLVEGNAGDDDILGGSNLESAPGVGDPDAGDFLYGGAGSDVVLGDNGQILRLVPGVEPHADASYVTTQLGVPVQRSIRLLDLGDPPLTDNFGDDQLSGGAGVDIGFGQDGDDLLSGGSEDDYQEGNGGSDAAWGDILLSAVASPLELPIGRTITVEPLPAGLLADNVSAPDELEGVQGAHGQDDQIGGSSRVGHRDAGDALFGDGAADFQLGDNGELLRTIEGAAYATYVEYNPTTVVRQANRFDVGGPDPDTSHGADHLQGDAGDDYQWGQDGDDELYGNDDNDDMYGELGNDRMFGGSGEDAMVGDRGLITDTLIVGDDRQVSADTRGPEFFSYTGLVDGQLDRRVDLLADGDGDMDGDGHPLESPGLHIGGDDFMRGGPGHDSMHGAFGDDLMNGDSGGDWLFGADGSDAIWGGRGSDDPMDPNKRDGTPGGIPDDLVDYLIGGHGLDFLDFRPRDGSGDPQAWFEITDTDDDAGVLPTDPTIANNQHHHGIDWIYGGWDRDVLQGDVGKNGPDFGDRLVDWVGAYNLYTRCNASYGDDGDIYKPSPAMEDLLRTLAYGSGVGATLADLRDPTTSAYRELGLVYKADIDSNSGSAFPETPGHFHEPSCEP